MSLEIVYSSKLNSSFYFFKIKTFSLLVPTVENLLKVLSDAMFTSFTISKDGSLPSNIVNSKISGFFARLIVGHLMVN